MIKLEVSNKENPLCETCIITREAADMIMNITPVTVSKTLDCVTIGVPRAIRLLLRDYVATGRGEPRSV